MCVASAGIVSLLCLSNQFFIKICLRLAPIHPRPDRNKKYVIDDNILPGKLHVTFNLSMPFFILELHSYFSYPVNLSLPYQTAADSTADPNSRHILVYFSFIYLLFYFQKKKNPDLSTPVLASYSSVSVSLPLPLGYFYFHKTIHSSLNFSRFHIKTTKCCVFYWEFI